MGVPELPRGGPARGMQQLQAFTAEINVFNRFFEAINRLFRNLHWLQINIVDSPLFRLAAVAIFCAYCVYLLHPCCWLHELFGLNPRIDQLARDAGPLVLVLAVIGFFYGQRLASDADRPDEQDENGTHAVAGVHRTHRRHRSGSRAPAQPQPHMV